MEAYFADRAAKGLGVPQRSSNSPRLSIKTIAVETGLPITFFHNAKIRNYIKEWKEKIGTTICVGDFLSPKKSLSEQRQDYIDRLNAYIDRLRSNGKKVPISRRKSSGPDYSIIARETRISQEALRHSKYLREPLNAACSELGLGIHTFDEAWEIITYERLFQYGCEQRSIELKDKPHSQQQLANTRTAFKRFLKYVSEKPEDQSIMKKVVGDEFGPDFQDCCDRIIDSIESQTTVHKFIVEINRWQEYYKQLINQLGLPDDFKSALKMAMERTGVSIKLLAKEADGNLKTISAWLAPESKNPSFCSYALIERIEKVLGLPPHALISRLSFNHSKRFKSTDYPESISVNGKVIEVRKNKNLLKKLTKLLPSNFIEKSTEEKQEMITWLYSNLIRPATLWRKSSGHALKATYSIKELPTVIAGEWKELSIFKSETLTPPGMKRIGKWRSSTKSIMENDLKGFIGFLSLPVNSEDIRQRGLGLDPAKMSLAILLCPKLIHLWIRWRGQRRNKNLRLGAGEMEADKHSTPGETYTIKEIDLLHAFRALLRRETGWLRQNPGLVNNLKIIPGFIDEAFIEKARATWDLVCDEALSYYKSLSQSLEEVFEQVRDPFEPILPILESENPMSALRIFAENILADSPNSITSPIKAARHLRNYLIVRILTITGLRSRNIRELTYRQDNTGHLRFEKGKWAIEIPYKNFKNSESGFFGSKNNKHPYRIELHDVHNLYDKIHEYIEVSRPILLDSTASDIFFVASKERPMFTTSAFHTNYTDLTRYYLAYNPYLSRGILGVKPHGPHAVRDIIATSIIKKTGNYEWAAYAIQDSVATVMRHYARFTPEDKGRLVNMLLINNYLGGLSSQ